MAPLLTDRLPILVPEIPSGNDELPDPSVHVMTLRRYMWTFGLFGGLLAITAAALSTGALVLLGHDLSVRPLSGGGVTGAVIALALFGGTWRNLISGLRDALPVVDTVRRGHVPFRAVIQSPGLVLLLLGFAAALTLITVIAGGSALQLQVLATGVVQILVAAVTLSWLTSREREEERRYLVRVETAGDHPARDLLWEPHRRAVDTGRRG